MDWDALVSRVTGYVPGCPRPLIRDHLIEGARRLCIDTHAWTVTRSPVYLHPHASRYPLNLPGGADLVVLDDLRVLDGDADPPPWPEIEPDNAMRFDAPPDEVVVEPVVVLAPSRDAEGLPDWLAGRHERAIRYAALVDLMDMPQTPWALPDYIPVYRDKYWQEVAEIRNRANKGRTNRSLTVKRQPFV